MAGVLAFAFMTFLSCQKEEIKLTKDSKTNKENATISPKVTNPYNFGGSAHNVVLDDCFNPTYSYSTLSARQKIQWIESRISSIFISGGNSSFVFANVSDSVTNLQLSNILSSSFDPETFYNSNFSGYLSSDEQFFLKEMTDLFDKYESDSKWSEFQSDIATLEDVINADAKLGFDSRQLLLGVCALGKNSFSYWTGNSGATPPLSIKIKPWLADVGGFVFGAWGSLQNGGSWDQAMETGGVVGTFSSAAAKL